MKKLLVVMLSLVLSFGILGTFIGCKSSKEDLYVAAFKGAYGEKHWEELVKGFEAKTGKKVKLVVDAKLEDTISPQLTAGTGPDLIYCAKGRASKLPEKLLESNGLEDLTSLLNEKVTGSDKKLSEILTADAKSGMYDNDKLYTIPLFVGLNGLFYNSDLFYANNNDGIYSGKVDGKYELPATWEEFIELGESLGENDPALFTYPTPGYLDALIPASIASKAGVDKLNDCFNYKDGIWQEEDVKAIFENLASIKPYIYENCVENGADKDGGWMRNQQSVIDGKTLFMCNGDWVKDEMKATTPAGFVWGTMPYLGFKDGDSTTTRYTSTVYEQVYVPTSAKNKDLAKEFILYIYSVEGQKIIAEHSNSAMLATTDYYENAKGKINDGALEGYKGYFDGTTKTIATNGFKATEDLPADASGFNDVMCGKLSDVWKKTNPITATEWVNAIESLSDIYRAHIKA